jgi:hypothetical protein
LFISTSRIASIRGAIIEVNTLFNYKGSCVETKVFATVVESGCEPQSQPQPQPQALKYQCANAPSVDLSISFKTHQFNVLQPEV